MSVLHRTPQLLPRCAGESGNNSHLRALAGLHGFVFTWNRTQQVPDQFSFERVFHLFLPVKALCARARRVEGKRVRAAAWHLARVRLELTSLVPFLTSESAQRQGQARGRKTRACCCLARVRLELTSLVLSPPLFDHLPCHLTSSRVAIVSTSVTGFRRAVEAACVERGLARPLWMPHGPWWWGGGVAEARRGEKRPSTTGRP